MSAGMRTHPSIALGVPEIVLPKPGVDLHKWAVIACDQYTSEPEYWEKVAAIVGDAPSTLHLTYPEVFLNEPNPEARIARIREAMRRYLDEQLFVETTGFVYLERTIGKHVRRGLMACLDLEQYDFSKGSTSPIRATEGTILDRIPPRVKIRQGATIELPHIMVLLDDPGDTVIGPLRTLRDRKPLYDVELMLGSGHVRGHLVDDPRLEAGIVRAIEALASPTEFARKCNVPEGTPVLLHAMGDGNHSLATAKTIWESAKKNGASMDSRLRYALVELVNLHDESLVFEPIHRVLFEEKVPVEKAFERSTVTSVPSFAAMRERVDRQSGPSHAFGLVREGGFSVVEIASPTATLPVGTLQAFLDEHMKKGSAKELDYVHGDEAVTTLGSKHGNVGIYLPGMKKEDLFRTVVLDGALPRKTFSMGEAYEKRFYLEGRRL
jgi:hypothetical protein